MLAVALVVAILPGIRGQGGDTGPMASAVTMSKVAQTPINATITLTGFGWGTRIDMVCTYGDYASRGQATTENLAMVLVGHDGTQNEIATWVGCQRCDRVAERQHDDAEGRDQVRATGRHRHRERCCCNQTVSRVTD